MKILLTGAQTNVGKYIKDYLKDRNTIYEYTEDMLNITNKETCYEIITKINPDILIHLDEMNNIDACERDETSAYTKNTIGTLNVAYPCSVLDIPIIYLSTSCVYSGKNNLPYFETDECNPINTYGKTKLAGEKLIRTLCKKYFIIRCGWIFGENDCFVNKIINNIKTPIFVCSSELGSPTYIEDLCIVINEMLTSDLYGVYNCGNPPYVTKSQWVKQIFDTLYIDKNILELPENLSSNCALRPTNSSINTSLLKNCFNIKPISWEERLYDYLKKFQF